MLPVIALVGRPNVGKSTLFNRITKSRDAIVANLPGLTRDRQYGEATIEGRPFIIIDTGGIGEADEGIDAVMSDQTRQAIEEAHLILFIVDARAGLTGADETIVDYLRKIKKPVLLVVNKTDGLEPDIACSEFHALGLGSPHPIAASHGRGVQKLLHYGVEEILPENTESTDESLSEAEHVDEGIKLAIVGRPNVGKSTLVNRMLGEERVIVYDMPGTTRDSIKIPLDYRGQQFTLIDTAGVRRRGKVKETVEKFSVVKTLQSIEESNVVLLLFDGQEGVTDQDLHLLGFILDAGKSFAIIINKWDGLSADDKQKIKRQMERKMEFVNYARTHFISALHGTGVGDLYKLVNEAYDAAMKVITTADVNRILAQAVEMHTPPLVQGRRVKLRYGHIGGHNPPLIVIHGNQTDAIPASYKRYLMNAFRKAFKLVGTPIRLEFITSDNPYKDKKNVRTKRQLDSRRRAMKHYKKSKKK